MDKLIVGIGEGIVTNNCEAEVKTFALGSCVAVIMLDPKLRIAAFSHIAHPESSMNPGKAQTLPCYFADTGIDFMLRELAKCGSFPHAGMIVKLIGGANINKGQDSFDIGKRNVLAIKKKLWEKNIMITNEDVGADYSRTVTLYMKNGKIIVSNATRDEWSV